MLEVDSPLAARKPCGLAWRTGQPSQTERPVNKDWTGQIMCPSRSFGGANQISIHPWPDSRALFAKQTEAGSERMTRCTLRLFAQSKCIYDR